MNIKIVQYIFEGESKYNILFNLTKQVNMNYCKLYNYNYNYDIFNKNMIQQLYGKFDWILACLYKIQYIYNNLLKDDCDYLVFLDADAAVSKPIIKIEDLVDEKHELFLSKGNEKVQIFNSLILLRNIIQNILNNYQRLINDSRLEYSMYTITDLFQLCEKFSHGSIFFNEGFIIIKNTLLMKQYFQDCINLIKYYIHRYVWRGKGYDGLIMDAVLFQKKYKNVYIFMYDQAQGGLKNDNETAYNVNTTFILHNYGDALTIDQKIEQINKLKSNIWWSQIK